MENQHRNIKGYRDLSQHEIDMMNRLKDLADECGAAVIELETFVPADQQHVSLGKVRLQEGFMWLIRSVAKPETFG